MSVSDRFCPGQDPREPRRQHVWTSVSEEIDTDSFGGSSHHVRETCLHCGQERASLVKLDNSLGFEASVLGIETREIES